MAVGIQSISHAGVRVHDLERSQAFYGFLGFELIAGPIGPEPVAILRHPAGVEINLVLNAHEDCQVNLLMDVPEKHPGYTHLAFRVADVAAAQRAIEAGGYALSGSMTFPSGARAIFLRDPDGNVVELNDVPEDMYG
jgi:lactoylglutathione lyase